MAGTEAIFPVVVRTSDAVDPTLPGDVLMSQYLAPHAIPGTRLNVMSKLFTRYRYENCKIEFTPVVSAIESGALLYVPVTDPGDTLTLVSDPNQVLTRGLDYENSLSANVYDPVTIPFPKIPEATEPSYCLPGTEARLETTNILNIFAMTNFEPMIGGQAELTLGWLRFHYDVRFYNPRMPQAAASIAPVYKAFNATWNTFMEANIKQDETMLGIANQWIPTESSGFFQLNFYSNWLVTEGGVLRVLALYNETKSEFDVVQGCTLYAAMNTEQTVNDHGDIMFYTCLEDVIGNTNPLRYGGSHSGIVSAHSTVNVLVTFVPMDQDL
jgi:hypothetical protein